MISFTIQSFGCRVNQAEAFTWAEEFQKNGLRYERDISQSDLVFVNTCTVTSGADRDVRKFLHRIPHINPHARIVVTGCFVERAQEELGKYTQVWKVIPNQEKAVMAERILEELGRSKRVSSELFRSRAFIKIQDGCDFNCTFCIIPSVRGKSRSVPQQKVLGKVRDAVSRGYQEIVLTGVHLCLYGRDFSPEIGLVNLLQQLDSIEGLSRFRLGSLDPRFLTPRLMDHLLQSSRICPHFHFSLQHGSDKIIHRMGRKVDVEQYWKVLEEFRRQQPRAALGADIIVGFPGETEDDFRATFDFVEKSPLDYLHVFSYSPRPGTPAADWAGVKSETKKDRAKSLLRLSAGKWLDFRRRFINEVCPAVVIEKSDDKCRVLTSNYINVTVSQGSGGVRDAVEVEIRSVAGKNTLGKIIS
ncbi:MAG: tRNA (N(6)-L-threonylcarbamoyladenosine(37)-C(2))-methylthiotransferase MtaB [Candidatus Aminicenantes bacterium]|nr:tRNA (N(6)-L-threonylcarbamoyladenosine(37)-C(2))-methylthiotransferase MtaB [Candidatus Aminicenantes bacterium]